MNVLHNVLYLTKTYFHGFEIHRFLVIRFSNIYFFFHRNLLYTAIYIHIYLYMYSVDVVFPKKYMI